MKTRMLGGRPARRPLRCWQGPARAHEGMWLFNNLPVEHLKKKHGFEPTEKWLVNLQKASIRFNSGGSGSFVSPDGLCSTNPHGGADALPEAWHQG